MREKRSSGRDRHNRRGSLDISELVRPNVLTLAPYEAKIIPCRVKLDANESPYRRPVSPRLLKAVETNRYPDPQAGALRREFARRMLPSSIGKKGGAGRVLHGNGSDELIWNLICTFGGPVVYPTPTFSMYAKIAQALGAKSVGVPLTRDFEIDDARMIRTMRDEKAKIVFISRPNNPTGNSFSEEKILRIIGKAECIVVVDEAYQPFSDKKSFLGRLAGHGNLAVLMTLSKIGFAGLRVGFLVAGPELIAQVNKVRLPFNVNSLSQAVAADALRNPGRLEGGIRKVVSERKRVFGALSKMKGVAPCPSDANFILFRVSSLDAGPRLDAGKVWRRALREGMLLRGNLGSELDRDFMRVTIGTRMENNAFIEFMKKTFQSARTEKTMKKAGDKILEKGRRAPVKRSYR
ncbi:MAG: histidinol-phosphate transaminase [Nitrospiraceae bacterium]|nr:histidinol-phosphate transaminase [Nitrospiraceae bacterium]